MKALGLNPGEQEVVDMTNEVSLHDDDYDLYIIGAVCMSVCHVFAYFIFSLF